MLTNRTLTPNEPDDSVLSSEDGHLLLPFEAKDSKRAEMATRASQIELLARFAPLFASTAIIAAFIASWAVYHALPRVVVFSWLGFLILFNLVSSRWIRQTGFAIPPHKATKNLMSRIMLDSTARAIVWVLIPAYAFARLGAIDQITLLLVVAVLICATLSLAASPLIAIGWIATLTIGMVIGMTQGHIDLPTTILCLLAIVPCFAIAGVIILGNSLRNGASQLAVAAEQRLVANNLLREYEERGGSWLWQTDCDNRVVFVSPQLCQLLNKPTKAILGQTLPGVFRGHTPLAEALLARRDFMGVELEVQGASGGPRWFALSGTVIFDKSKEYKGFRGVGVDITESKFAQQKLQHLANLDNLTGLPNRQRVRELLDEALRNSMANSTPCALLFLDLDGFKPVNDTFGHAKGDVVLKSVADRLIKQVGSLGTVGRIGGDEFAIVIHDAQSRRAVEHLGARIIDAVSAPYETDSLSLRIGLSVGCAYGPIDANSVDELIQKADFALYNAKAEGRGTFRSFEPEMQAAAEDRIRLENDMRSAIGSDQFYLVYQPQLSVDRHVVVGFEALLRWQHPKRGFISPATFIPIAEESGLIVQLGEWVLKTACRDAALWPGHISVAVNISPLQLQSPGLPNAVAEALNKARLASNRLELEVTESVFLGDSDYSISVLQRLRDLGISIALDDFGTGYSSLGYLNRAVFHKLKIDGSFVRESASTDESTAIIKAMVSLAEAFRMTVTAECVETKEDLMRMKELGCHLIQGFLFGRPMTQDKTLELLHAAQSSRHRAA